MFTDFATISKKLHRRPKTEEKHTLRFLISKQRSTTSSETSKRGQEARGKNIRSRAPPLSRKGPTKKKKQVESAAAEEDEEDEGLEEDDDLEEDEEEEDLEDAEEEASYGD